MYLVDTNVISELRKGQGADRGVVDFFFAATTNNERCYLSVITVGELRRGIEMIRHRGDVKQANAFSEWYAMIVREYANQILTIDVDVVSIWSDLRVPHYENALDKLIAATALLHSLQVVTASNHGYLLSECTILQMQHCPTSKKAKQCRKQRVEY